MKMNHSEFDQNRPGSFDSFDPIVATVEDIRNLAGGFR